MIKKIILLALICCIILNFGCKTIKTEDSWPPVSLKGVQNCERQYADSFFMEKFGVDSSGIKIKTCLFKQSDMGYGGSIKQNVWLDDVIFGSVDYSGMGSGGHGSTDYCFYALDQSLVDAAQEKRCNMLEYFGLNESAFIAGNEGADPIIYNATKEIVKACREGIFTFSAGNGKVFSYIQAEGRGGKSVQVGSFDCVQQEINANASMQKIEEIVNGLKS